MEDDRQHAGRGYRHNKTKAIETVLQLFSPSVSLATSTVRLPVGRGTVAAIKTSRALGAN